jgi:hypothetical protein
MLKPRLGGPALAGVLLLLAFPRSGATVITEDFSTDPRPNGWSGFGNTNLFHWNPTNQNLEVTWDSSQPNSYFHHPLGTILARDDGFSLAFDLRLEDIGPGTDTNKPYAFELALGFLNLGEAIHTNFLRSTGYDSPDLFEFDYFWDAGYGATVSPAIVDTNSNFNWNGTTDYAKHVLIPSNWYHVTMTYTASNQTLITTLTNFGQTDSIAITNLVNSFFTDFRVDAFSISSYSDAGQDPQWGEGSILAHGVVDNLVVTVPPPPVQSLTGAFTNNIWQAQFLSRSNWLYTLERAVDLRSWTNATPATPGSATLLILQDTNPPSGRAFYRVRANRQ